MTTKEFTDFMLQQGQSQSEIDVTILICDNYNIPLGFYCKHLKSLNASYQIYKSLHETEA